MGFCTNCGSEINGQAFCVNCGTPAKVETPTEATMASPAGDAPGINPKTQLIIKLVIVAVIVAIVVGIAAAVVSAIMGPKAIAKKHLKAFYNYDAEEVISLNSTQYIDFAVDEYYDGDKDEYIENIQDNYDIRRENDEDADIDYSKAKFEVTRVKDLDKDDIEDLFEYYNEEYDADFKTRAAKEVKVKVTYEEDGDKETMTTEIILVKEGLNWRVW